MPYFFVVGSLQRFRSRAGRSFRIQLVARRRLGSLVVASSVGALGCRPGKTCPVLRSSTGAALDSAHHLTASESWHMWLSFSPLGRDLLLAPSGPDDDRAETARQVGLPSPSWSLW